MGSAHDDLHGRNVCVIKLAPTIDTDGRQQIRDQHAALSSCDACRHRGASLVKSHVRSMLVRL